MGPRYLRDDGKLLADSRPRRRGGIASDPRLGSQAGEQAEVRDFIDPKGLSVEQHSPRRRRPSLGDTEIKGCDSGWCAPWQWQARHRIGSAGSNRRVHVPRPTQNRRPRPDPVPEWAAEYTTARFGLGETVPLRRSRHALSVSARLTIRSSRRRLAAQLNSGVVII